MDHERREFALKRSGTCEDTMDVWRKCFLQAESGCSNERDEKNGSNRLRFSAGIGNKSHEVLVTAREDVPVRIGGWHLDVDASDTDGDFSGYFEEFETDRSDRGIGQLSAFQTESTHTLQEQVCQST